MISKQELLDRLREFGFNITETAKHFGIPRTTLRECISKYSINVARDKKAREKLDIENDGKGIAITSLSKTIRTVEDAVKEAKVDLNIWYVDRYLINKWDSARGTQSDGWDALELWQVKVWLSRKVLVYLENTDALFEMVRKKAPKSFTSPNVKDTKNHLLEISPIDSHFGKLAWGQETGEDYDLPIARKYFLNAIMDSLEMGTKFPIERILLPIGQDFLHVDNLQNSTFLGTSQDVDGRLPKIFRYAADSLVKAIEMCLKVAPVQLLWVPGNHDRTTSWYMAEFVRAWFHGTNFVNVDTSPKTRKALLYGITLTGFCHGDTEPKSRLPVILAAEWPDLWAKSKFRQWHCGHVHHRKTIETMTSDGNSGGVEVVYLPSLCGLDAWHYEHGFVGSPKAADSFLYNKVLGPVCRFTSYART